MSRFLLLQTAHARISQAYGFRLPGYLIVESRVPAAGLHELEPEPARDLMRCLGVAEGLLHRLLEPERVYALKFGEEVPAVHFHVVPRSAEIAAAYRAATGDAPPLSGAALVDWIWSNHERLGHTDEALEAFVERARAALQGA